jgi:hypothetical protein
MLYWLGIVRILWGFWEPGIASLVFWEDLFFDLGWMLEKIAGEDCWRRGELSGSRKLLKLVQGDAWQPPALRGLFDEAVTLHTGF